MDCKNASTETQDAWDTIEKAITKIHEKEVPLLNQYTDEYLLEKLSKVNFRLFQFADMFDLYLFCIRELQLGNNTERMITMRMNAKDNTLKRVLEIKKAVSSCWSTEEVVQLFSDYMQSSGYTEFQAVKEDIWSVINRSS